MPGPGVVRLLSRLRAPDTMKPHNPSSGHLHFRAGMSPSTITARYRQLPHTHLRPSPAFLQGGHVAAYRHREVPPAVGAVSHDGGGPLPAHAAQDSEAPGRGALVAARVGQGHAAAGAGGQRYSVWRVLAQSVAQPEHPWCPLSPMLLPCPQPALRVLGTRPSRTLLPITPPPPVTLLHCLPLRSQLYACWGRAPQRRCSPS